MKTRESFPLVVDDEKQFLRASSDHRIIMGGPASTRTARTDESLSFINWVFLKRSFRKPRLLCPLPIPLLNMTCLKTLLKELFRSENTSPYFGSGRSRLKILEVRVGDGLPLLHKALSIRALTQVSSPEADISWAYLEEAG